MYWPRQAHPDDAARRPLAHWYAAPHDRGWPETAEIAEADRRALIPDVLASQGHDSDVGLLADLFIGLADGDLPGGVLAWSLGALERFLLDRVHRRTILDPEDLEAFPDALAG